MRFLNLKESYCVITNTYNQLQYQCTNLDSCRVLPANSGPPRPSRFQKTSGFGEPSTAQSMLTDCPGYALISFGSGDELLVLQSQVGGTSTISCAEATVEPTEFSTKHW